MWHEAPKSFVLVAAFLAKILWPGISCNCGGILIYLAKKKGGLLVEKDEKARHKLATATATAWKDKRKQVLCNF